jgi:hypothetical protein
MLDSLASLFCLLSQSHFKRHPSHTLNQDPLLQLLDSSLTFDTGSLLHDIGLFAMVSPNSAQEVLDRFMVQGLTHCKDIQVRPWAPTGTNPQHEFILVELEDTKLTSSKPLFIILERAALSASVPLQPSPAHSSIAVVMSESLLPSDSLSPYKAVATDEFELTPPSHASTQSTSSVVLADDRFVGSKNLGAYANSTVNQVHPQSLSLFELAVLADAIHNHNPHYSTLPHQRFWFATTLCNIVVREYDCITVTGSAPSISRDEVGNRSIPGFKFEGRCMGVMTDRAEDAVSSAIASNFRKYLQEKENEVHFFFLSGMSLAEIQTQIKSSWNQYHGREQPLQTLQTKVSHLEAIIRVNNFDLDMALTA